MSSCFLTLVTLSLPLSSLWAAANIEASRSEAASRQPILAGSYTASGKKTNNYLSSAMSQKSATLLDTPTTMGPRSPFPKEPLDDDVEMGRMNEVKIM